MNYLVAVDYFFLDRPGGAARVAWDIALAMRARGHNVAILCMHQPNRPRRPDVSEHEGVRVARFDRPNVPAWHPGRVGRIRAAGAAAARNHLADVRWDVVHLHTALTGLAARDALGAGPRYIATVHSPIVLEQEINWRSRGAVGRLKLLFGRGLLMRLEREYLNAADRVHTLSEYTKLQMQRFHGQGSRAVVIPHWRRAGSRRTVAKGEARRRLGWPEDAPVFFSVRRLGPRYGLDDAIRAVAPLAAARRCCYFIGGDGDMRPALEQLIDELGVGDRVRLLGRISDEDLALAYQAADLFLLPTRALECFGLITLEAFSYGCPVLSSDAGAIPETMAPVQPDFIVPAGDVTALQAKLSAYIEGTLVPPGGEALLAYLDQRFSEEAVLPQLVALLEGTDGAAPAARAEHAGLSAE